MKVPDKPSEGSDENLVSTSAVEMTPTSALLTTLDMPLWIERCFDISWNVSNENGKHLMPSGEGTSPL